jgi:hypothetical protein
MRDAYDSALCGGEVRLKFLEAMMHEMTDTQETHIPGQAGNSILHSKNRYAPLFRTKDLVVAVCLFILFCVSSNAQVQNGTINGTVMDANNAVIPSATVTVTQVATGLVLHGDTNGQGLYNFPQLPLGDYTVAVDKPGFRKATTSLTLTVGQVAQVDLVLQVGSQTDTVTIQSDNAASLDTQTSNLDYTVEAKQVDALPLNGRNPYGLAALSPGIIPGQYFGAGVAVARGAVVAAATNNFQSNGGIGGSNEVLLDGVSIVVCCQGQPAVTPSVEMVSQFKVVTSAAPAEYGRTSGAVLNLATKSGTNRLRGDVYDFLRNDKLDAANFFTKRSGIYPYPGHQDFRAPHRENQFGVFVGGPIVLPRIYNGKDNTFFTFNYEGVRNLAPTVGTTTVPTTLMREGIFTEAPSVVYDPTSYNATSGQRTPIAAATCNGTAYGPGYCIPPSSLNPAAQALLQFMPAPNLPGTVNNYSYVENVFDSDDQFTFRVDHNFSDKQRAFIRGTRGTDNYLNYDEFNKANGPNTWAQDLTAYLFAVGDVWTLSPQTLLQFSYGFARQTNSQVYDNLFKLDASKYGFSNQFTSEQQVVGLPGVAISGFQATVAHPADVIFAHYTHSLNASVLMLRGRHSLALGYQGEMVLENESGLTAPTGTFAFNTQFTGGPTPNSALPAGQSAFDSWASYLFGYPGTGSIVRQETVAFNQWVTGLYIQDDWRLTNNFTVNMGLRWDIETGFAERHNRWADFNPNVTNPLSTPSSNVPGGAQFLGVSGNPSRTWPTYFHEVGPRLGASWAIQPGTVARGAYGILYLPTSQRLYNNSTIGFSQTTNIATSANGYIPAVTLDNPFPTGVSLPTGASAGVAAGAGSTISAYQYNNPNSYQQQWNFGIEQSLGNATSLSLNYVGGHGIDLPLNVRPDDLQPQYFGAPGSSSQVAYLQAQVPNPFYGQSVIAPGSQLLQPTVQRAQLLAAFPQYSSGSISGIANASVGILSLNHGSANYNALQATWKIQQHNGLFGTVSYVWSKLLGNVSDLTNGFLNTTGNPGIQDYYFLHQYEHSNLATDIPQRVVGTMVYPLPFGKGKMIGANMPRWADQAAGGWAVTAIIDVYSGFPISMGVSGATAFAGTRPMYVAGVSPLTSGSTHQRLGGVGQSQSYLNPAAFALPLAFQLGNVPRSAAALRGPLSFDDNVSVSKAFPIHDDLALEFRAEAFNILNKVDFGLPAATVGGAGFGSITSQYNLPRNLQVALRLHF